MRVDRKRLPSNGSVNPYVSEHIGPSRVASVFWKLNRLVLEYLEPSGSKVEEPEMTLLERLVCERQRHYKGI